MNSKEIPNEEELEFEREREESPVRPLPDRDDIAAAESFSSAREETIDSASLSEETDIEKLKVKLAQQEDKYLRLAAEFENYKKRSLRQFDDAVGNAEAEVFRPMLEIFDNFKRALELPENQKSFESFEDGLKMIYEQMKKFLDKHKIESIKTVGQKFNPDLHEAVMQIETDEHPEGTVASELGGGFKRGEKVIQHAKVGVSKGKTKK